MRLWDLGPKLLHWAFFISSECPKSFPTINIPANLKLGEGQDITCISPGARPSLDMQMFVDNDSIPIAAEVSADKNKCNITTAAALTLYRHWNGGKLRCCFYSAHCEKVCSPEKPIKLQCKLFLYDSSVKHLCSSSLKLLCKHNLLYQLCNNHSLV